MSAAGEAADPVDGYESDRPADGHGPDGTGDEYGPAGSEDPDAVVETDFIAGGWAAWDLSARPPRPKPRPAPRAPDPEVLLRRSVAEMVVAWRSECGLQQRHAASRLGVTQSWLSRIERCRVPVSLDLLARLAAVTGSDVSVRIAPEPCGPPVRRIARTGQVGRATVQFVITGPEARTPSPTLTPAPGSGHGGHSGDRRPPGPIF